MDLETVELIMAVEEEFMIEIPDPIAETILSVGELRSLVETELHRQHRDRDSENLLDRISAIAASFGGVDRANVGPGTMLAEDLGLK